MGTNLRSISGCSDPMGPQWGFSATCDCWHLPGGAHCSRPVPVMDPTKSWPLQVLLLAAPVIMRRREGQEH